MPSGKNLRSLARELVRIVYLVLDCIGLSLLFLSQIVPPTLAATLSSIGLTFITIGITQPITIFFQALANADSFELIKRSDRAGLAALFESRHSDRVALDQAIDAATAKTDSDIWFCGIALRSLFDPNSPRSQIVGEKIHENAAIRLRILLLDYQSEAAKRRAAIERGNTTIQDIEYTLDNGLTSVIESRLRQRAKTDPATRDLWAQFNAGGVPQRQQALDALVGLANVQVRLYAYDPMMFIMGFSDSVFVEQYLFGRAIGLSARSCIGKRVPVLHFKRSSQMYEIAESHFEYIWKDNNTRDVTAEIVKRALLTASFTMP